MRKAKSFRHTLASAALALLLLIQPGLTLVAAAQESPGRQDDSADERVDPRFGVIEAFWEADEAAELGVGWDRILFYWNEIQPTGPDDWNTLHVLEEWLDDARANDRMVMGLLKNTPAWATDAEPFSGVPRGLYLPVDDPGNLWAGYVGKVVDYYAPLGVHHWIIWNEPEIEPGVYGHEFGGSTQDYYRLLKVAYQVAKARDPQAVVHLAGWSYWHDPGWLGEFLQVATADPEGRANNYFFDVITLHIYFRVETVEELVEEVWDIQQRYDLRKPIWINETNASPNLDPLWPVERPNFQVDLEQQAWYIIQAHALGFGARSARIGVYKLLDVLLPPGGESFGILRPDGSRRPAFDAYRTTIRYLSGFTYPVGRQQARDFYAFAFERPQGVTRVLWARTASDVVLRVPALADEAVFVSATGVEQPRRAVDGFYRVRLRGARCTPECDIGGAPVFIVESGVELPADVAAITIDPETARLATPTPTLSATATTAAPGAESPPAVATQPPTVQPTATQLPTMEPSLTPTAPPTVTPIVVMLPTATGATATATTDAAPAVADAAPPGAPPVNASGSSVQLDEGGTEASAGALASWFFIGAAVILAAMLALIVARQRQA